MKLCNILSGIEIHLAAESKRGIIDLTAAGYALKMDELISGADRSAIEAFIVDNNLPVVEDPVFANVTNSIGKLICVGLNYKAHAEGVKLGTFDVPALFSKFGNALAPCGAEIELPSWEDTYDYEAELVIVIGKKAWNVSVDEAMEHIFGYTCGNDLSCRKPQKLTSQWLIGKTMPGFGPCGPFIVTADSLDAKAGVGIRSYVNGELRQNGSTADMIYGCSEIISHASKYIALEPGDLIFTGTPAGVALEENRDKRRWLVKGDRVDVEIDGIGRLTNYMV